MASTGPKRAATGRKKTPATKRKPAARRETVAVAIPPAPAAGLKPIETETDLAEGVQGLMALDPRLDPILAVAGEVPLRLRPPGFEGLCRIIVSQQLSVASAAAIWTRVEAGLGEVEAHRITACDDDALRAMGLSRPKLKALRAVAEAVEGGLDLHRVATLSAEDAHASLCAVKGIGPWTADIYLLFCAGHPDIFPAGDLALQNAVADGFALKARPTIGELQAIAGAWTPWRGVAARLFWAFYKARREGREALPV